MKVFEKYGLIIIVPFAFFMFYKPAVCFLIIGLALLYFGIDSTLFLNDISKNGVECFGKILVYESDSEGYKTPVVEFKTIEGNIFTGKPYYYAASDLSKFRTYKNSINKDIKLLYNPENPEKFIIKTEEEINYGSIIMVITISLVFTGVAMANILGYLNMDN